MKINHIISNFKETKSKSFEIITLSICMALGINFLASGITLLDQNKMAMVYIVMGISLALLMFVIMLIKLLKSLNKCEKIKGFFIYDNETSKIIEIPEYAISRDMNDYLRAAFSENTAIRAHWMAGKLSQFFCDKNDDNMECQKLFNELLEYCVLEKLSVVICDYFNKIEKKINKTQEYSRENIADVLLTNRFLSLFSEPMSNRGVFVNSDCSENIVEAYGPGGVRYSSFNLTLPKGSRLKRLDKNTILIDMKSFTIKIACLFEGYNTYIDSWIHEYYIGLHNNEFQYSDHMFEINIDVKWKLKALLYINDWKYYDWIDAFIDKLYDYADNEAFLEKINWNSVKTYLRCLMNGKIQ